MQYLFKLFLGCIIFTSCSDIIPSGVNKNADSKDMKVRDFITIDTSNSGNEIILAKVCVEHPSFKYIYQIKNGTWIVSNSQWCVGSRINITATNVQ